MASAFYGKALEAFGNGAINWASDTIKAMLVDTAFYTVDLAAHDYLDDIPLGARVGSAVTLASKTNVLGVFDAADIVFTGLTSAPSIEALVLFKDTGNDATSNLIAYIDTATGLPVAAGATQVNVTWDNGANRIGKL